MIRRAFASLLRGYIWHTPPHPGRGLLGKLAWRLDPRDIVHEVAPGVKLRLQTRYDDHIGYWADGYEQDGEMAVFLGLLTPGMTVFDIGANVGMYSVAASRRVGPAGRVFAFEPMPPIRDRLHDTLALNGVRNVTVCDVALSDQCGTAEFHVGRLDSLGSLVRPTHSGPPVTVQTLTMDEFCTQHDIRRVDAIKMDVEGAEQLVLRGMREVLRDRPLPILQMEFNDPALRAAGTTPNELFQEVIGFGYAAFAVVGGQLVPTDTPISPSRPSKEPTVNYIFRPAA